MTPTTENPKPLNISAESGYYQNFDLGRVSTNAAATQFDSHPTHESPADKVSIIIMIPRCCLDEIDILFNRWFPPRSTFLS